MIDQTTFPRMVQVQQEVSRLQSLVSDQLPKEKQRQQQRIQAISQALDTGASPEVRLCSMHAGLLTYLGVRSPDSHRAYYHNNGLSVWLLALCPSDLMHGIVL